MPQKAREYSGTQARAHMHTLYTQGYTRGTRVYTQDAHTPECAECVVRCAAVEQSRKAAMGLGAATGVPAWCSTVEYLLTLSMVQYHGVLTYLKHGVVPWFVCRL